MINFAAYTAADSQCFSMGRTTPKIAQHTTNRHTDHATCDIGCIDAIYAIRPKTYVNVMLGQQISTDQLGDGAHDVKSTIAKR